MQKNAKNEAKKRSSIELSTPMHSQQSKCMKKPKKGSLQKDKKFGIYEDIHSLSLRCPICLETLGKIVLECHECHCTFCHDCLHESLKRKSTCPLCRNSPRPLRRNRPIERIVSSLPVNCAFESNGCGKVITRGTIDVHELSCEYQRFTCTFCDNDYLRKDHDEKHCHQRTLPCPFAVIGCKNRSTVKDMKRHTEDQIHFDLARRELTKMASKTEFSSEVLSALRNLFDVANSSNKKMPSKKTESNNPNYSHKNWTIKSKQIQFLNSLQNTRAYQLQKKEFEADLAVGSDRILQ